MPLGRQFQNTFFNNAEGRTTYYTDPASLPAEKEHLADPEFQIKEPSLDRPVMGRPSPSTSSRRPLVETGPSEVTTGHKGVAYQGMFFDPYAHTGHRFDPTISEETRKETIAKSLNLTNPDEYKRKLEFVKGSVSKKDVPKHIDAITKKAHESGIPTHFFQNDINVSAVIKKNMGHAGGDYSRYGNEGQIIRLRHQEEYPDTEWVDTQVPKYTHGKELSNPGALHDVVNTVNKKTGGDHYRTTAIIGSHINHYGAIDEKGEQYTPAVRNERGFHDNSKALDFVSNNMPEGHGLNLWPGKGEETDEYTVAPMKMHMGYNDNGRAMSAMFHRRFEKVPTGETRTLTTRVRGEAQLRVSESTIVHELGHALDPNVDTNYTHNKGGYDTVKEAIADGFRDRFHTYKDSYEDALHPQASRTKDMTSSGYTIKDKSVAPTRMHAALYAAARIHTSLGDRNYQDIESRNDLYKKASGVSMTGFQANYGSDPLVVRRDANSLLLGHLYATHAHVRQHLQNLGLDDEGEKAAHTYRSSITDAGRSPHYLDHISPALPGFEEHGEY